MRAEYSSDPLELATYDVTGVEAGATSTWSDGRLTLDLAGVTERARHLAPAVAELAVRLVHPGEPVRIANVLDVIVPDVKAADPDATFPGVLGALRPAGRGRTHRLAGLRVLTVCDWRSAGLTTDEEFPDSYVDMAGPGQAMTAWGAHPVLVVSAVPKPDAALGDVDRSLRTAALSVARDAAAATLGQLPSRVESFELPAVADTDLPRVAAILQVASEGPLVDTFLYGGAVPTIVPTLLDHREILDGALTNGAYDWPAVRNLTASYQDSALVRSLVAQHGTTLQFAGVVLALGYLDTSIEKERSAMQSARLCRLLGAEGVVCTTFSSGNSHTDTMLTVRACEAEGIRAVAIISESNGGLTDHVPEADVLISTGNHDELVDPWLPEEVLGAPTAMAGEPVPLWSYVGACVQTGDFDLMAAPA
jgi:glycine reductase complex component B subunit alpha and beta